MNPARRSLYIVSRDPLQCSELVLSLQSLLDPDDEVEIILDRRRERGVFEAKSEGLDQPPIDRRRNPHVDLEVRTKGFATVPAAPMTPRSSTAPDAAERERFGVSVVSEGPLSSATRPQPQFEVAFDGEWSQSSDL